MTPTPETDTALAIRTLEIAVTTLSGDIREMKGILRNQDERLSAAVADLSVWRAGHEASGPSSHAFEAVTGRVTAVENKISKIEERQDTSRLLLIPTIVATIAAFVKAFLFSGKP